LDATPEQVKEHTTKLAAEKAADEAEEKRRREESENKRREEAVREWVDKVAPRRYATASFDRLPGPLGKTIREEMNKGNWPYLAGGLGTGKTFVACAIARECLSKGKRVEFACVPMLLARIRKAMDEGSGGPEKIVDLMSEIDVLVLDDMAAEKASDWVSETMFRIIDTRYSELRMTVITSNIMPHEIANERVRSRLCEVVALIGLTRERPERSNEAE
jgi:DNA replication protein DnaC/primosomal protein DnaI